MMYGSVGNCPVSVCDNVGDDPVCVCDQRKYTNWILVTRLRVLSLNV